MNTLKTILELPWKLLIPFLRKKERKDSSKAIINSKDTFFYGRRARNIINLTSTDWRKLGKTTASTQKGNISVLLTDINVIRSRFLSEWDIQRSTLEFKLKELQSRKKIQKDHGNQEYMKDLNSELDFDIDTIEAYIKEVTNYIKENQKNDMLLSICIAEYRAGFELGKAFYLNSTMHKRDLIERLIPSR